MSKKFGVKPPGPPAPRQKGLKKGLSESPLYSSCGPEFRREFRRTKQLGGPTEDFAVPVVTAVDGRKVPAGLLSSKRRKPPAKISLRQPGDRPDRRKKLAEDARKKLGAAPRYFRREKTGREKPCKPGFSVYRPGGTYRANMSSYVRHRSCVHPETPARTVSEPRVRLVANPNTACLHSESSAPVLAGLFQCLGQRQRKKRERGSRI